MTLLLRLQATRVATLRSLFHSSRTAPAPISQNTKEKDLSWRVETARNPTISIVPVLDQWLEQGNQVKQWELRNILKTLRKSWRFKHALQLFNWANEQKAYTLSAGDHATKLELVSRVHGNKAAEMYFQSIPVEMRNDRVYGSLLQCYASKKLMQKAEDLMQKMRDQGYAKGSFCYNVMLRLYCTLGNCDKMNNLFKEMEEEQVKPDKFILHSRLHAFVEMNDVDGMERFLAKWEADSSIGMCWKSYVIAANGFLKAGLKEKALVLLRRSEQLIEPESRRYAYEILMKSYADANKKEDVYRLWNLYSMIRFHHRGYIIVINSLFKVDDIEGVERIFEEWETRHVYFDLRVPNFLISGYCKNGMMEKAEEFVNSLIDKGKVLNMGTWDRLAWGYTKANQMEKAVERWKKAILASKPGERFYFPILNACINYLEEKGDVENLKDVLRLLHEHGHLSRDKYDRLLDNEGGGESLYSQIVHALLGDRLGNEFKDDSEGFNGKDGGKEIDLEFERNN